MMSSTSGLSHCSLLRHLLPALCLCLLLTVCLEGAQQEEESGNQTQERQERVKRWDARRYGVVQTEDRRGWRSRRGLPDPKTRTRRKTMADNCIGRFTSTIEICFFTGSQGTDNIVSARIITQGRCESPEFTLDDPNRDDFEISSMDCFTRYFLKRLGPITEIIVYQSRLSKGRHWILLGINITYNMRKWTCQAPKGRRMLMDRNITQIRCCHDYWERTSASQHPLTGSILLLTSLLIARVTLH